MNQILYTGEGDVIKPLNTQKRVLPINVIVLLFSITIIILGICIIASSVFSKQKINETVAANIKPVITLERNDDENLIEIKVTHEQGIKNIIYSWNEGEETTIEGNNRKDINESIDLIGGENTLKVSATGQNGQIMTTEKIFIGNMPEISLDSVVNGVKVNATSKEEIDYIQYNWDDGEWQKINVGDNEYEGIINTPPGKHTLKIEAIDINGIKAEIERSVIGDTEPTVKIQSKLIEGKATFVITAEDDEQITTIEILHNGGEIKTINVNEKTFAHQIVMTEGETNKLVVRVTNVNGLQKTQAAKFNNK